MKFKALFLIIWAIPFFSFSQTPTHTAPTLQVGLDGLAFGKGTLDSELILEIIAEKQNEIKLRVAQNILLGPLNDCGATIYAFGDDILKAVIEEKDPIIRKRKILESTVNTIFAIGFTQYYLNRIRTDSLPIYLPQKNALIEIEKIIFNNPLKSNNGASFTPGTQEDNKYANSIKQLKYYSTILDIASATIRNNRTLTELGILNISYSKTYDYQSNFLNFETSEQNRGVYVRSAQTLFNGMKAELDILTKLIGVTKFLLDEKNLRISSQSIVMNTFSDAPQNFNYNNLKTKLKELSQNNTDSIKSVKISKIYNYLDKVENRSSLTVNDWSDIVYAFNNEFIPTVENLGISKTTTFDLIEIFRKGSKFYANKILANTDFKNTIITLSKEENINFFTNLLSRLYEFDKGSTYIEYFNLISEISNFLEQSPDFKNSEVKEKLSYFNTFVKDYVVVNETEEGKDYIDFNVESFLNHLAEMKSNQPSIVTFMFDVGVSTGYFVKQPYEITPGSTLENISFISEKIGLKVKFIDRKFWMTRSPGETYQIRGKGRIKTGVPKEPIISNYFWMLYGSGILYNIFDTSTEKEFNSPFVGTGFGIGFFNNLDLSITAAIPITSNQSFSESFKYPLLSLNFDIRFTEYLQRLGEKRNAAQTQKALAKAGQ